MNDFNYFTIAQLQANTVSWKLFKVDKFCSCGTEQ